MNASLLKRIRDTITAHPKNFTMGDWIIGPPSPSNNDRPVVPGEEKKCGTIACIAGLAVLLAAQRPLESREALPKRVTWTPRSPSIPPCRREFQCAPVAAVAAELLQLTNTQALELFFADSWPEPYKGKYMVQLIRKDQAGMVDTAVRRINYMLRTCK